tara:strand:+ start:416 stop:664 length:249 start_codon:yes stop_codon:yes gene_type:complete
MLTYKCKECNRELTTSKKLQCCGCPNMMTVEENKISALDLGKVISLNSTKNDKSHDLLTRNDLEYQENRRKRKVRRLDFEVR